MNYRLEVWALLLCPSGRGKEDLDLERFVLNLNQAVDAKMRVESRCVRAVPQGSIATKCFLCFVFEFLIKRGGRNHLSARLEQSQKLGESSPGRACCCLVAHDMQIY